MTVMSYDAFVNMYYALTAYEGIKSDRLREFTSDADPFIWKDKGSADPAVYLEFKQAWNKRFADGYVSAPEARLFARDYLKAQDDGEYAFAPAGDATLVGAFDSVADEEAWEYGLANL